MKDFFFYLNSLKLSLKNVYTFHFSDIISKLEAYQIQKLLILKVRFKYNVRKHENWKLDKLQVLK